MARAQLSDSLIRFPFISWIILYLLVMTTQMALANPFFNEIHYDNDGSDIGEALEIAGPVDIDLDSWRIILYNGSNGEFYKEIPLSGNIPCPITAGKS